MAASWRRQKLAVHDKWAHRGGPSGRLVRHAVQGCCARTADEAPSQLATPAWFADSPNAHVHPPPAPCPKQVNAAKRLPADVRRRLAEALQPRNLRECVVCGDVPEDPLVSVCSHIYCAECFGAELSKAGQGAVGEWLGWVGCAQAGLLGAACIQLEAGKGRQRAVGVWRGMGGWGLLLGADAKLRGAALLWHCGAQLSTVGREVGPPLPKKAGSHLSPRCLWPFLPAEAELAYSCPHCGHTLGKHDTFSAAALAKADPALAQQAQQGASQQQQQGGAAAASAGTSAGASGSEAAQWETSAKLEALMEILKKLRDKGAAGRQPALLVASVAAAACCGCLGAFWLGGRRAARAARLARIGRKHPAMPLPTCWSKPTQLELSFPPPLPVSARPQPRRRRSSGGRCSPRAAQCPTPAWRRRWVAAAAAGPRAAQAAVAPPAGAPAPACPWRKSLCSARWV